MQVMLALEQEWLMSLPVGGFDDSLGSSSSGWMCGWLGCGKGLGSSRVAASGPGGGDKPVDRESPAVIKKTLLQVGGGQTLVPGSTLLVLLDPGSWIHVVFWVLDPGGGSVLQRCGVVQRACGGVVRREGGRRWSIEMGQLVCTPHPCRHCIS